MVVLGSLREQHPEAAIAGGKGQQYLKTVAEYKPLSLGLIYFGAFRNVSQSSTGCCIKSLCSSWDVRVFLCVCGRERFRRQ